MWNNRTHGPANGHYSDTHHIQARTARQFVIVHMQVPRLLVMTQPSTSLENTTKAVEDTSKLSKSQKKRAESAIKKEEKQRQRAQQASAR